MTATADRFGPGRSREELRLVELASGLLMLLDAYRLTGRLPLEVQVQTGRLRHAVKLAVQAEAARTATRPPTLPAAAGPDQAAALRAWIAAQPWAQPGPQGWVYLLCFRDPATGQHAPLVGNGCRGQYAGHYWGWTDDLVRRINQHRNPRGRGPGRLVQVALAAGLTFELAWLEYPATRGRERRLKNQGSAYRRCPLCRGTGGPLDPAAAVAAVHRAPPPRTAACWKEVTLMARRTTWLIDMGDGTWAVCCMACRIGLYRGRKAGADRAARNHYCEPVVPLGRRRRPA